MDPYSSGDVSNIKTRKPYTITKQRERWTEEEHNSFLEALKLYGRAWQRIEEHIGSKTAVQIRSHAQKFFTKLEKEAVAKGVPARQALDMEIPPPRPKRKPNYPYPRKTGSCTGPKNHQKDDAKSLQSGIQTLRKPTIPIPESQTTSHEQKHENQEAPCASLSLSSENENSIPRSVVVAAAAAAADGGVFSLAETNESSYITTVTRNHQKSSSVDQDKIKHTASLFEFPQSQNSDDTQGGGGVYNHNYPRHVPVQVVDGNQSVPCPLEMSLTIENPNPNLSVNNNRIASSYQQTVPTFHPPPPVFTPSFSDSQENYTSFLRVSSTISSLIVSSLLQNPAAHAAASFAAKFWHPPGNGNTEAASSSSSSETPPSMAAIAAATVAAATAWWAAHGLLPVCYPPPFSFPMDANQAPDNGREKAPEKTPQSSSSEDSGGKLNNTDPNPDDDNTTKVEEVHDSSNNNVRKQVDRSSCGSNTTSSSEIETDALEKNINNIKEKEASDAANLASCNDSVSRNRARSTINPNESWKEVSEEGRLAFQALFSRQVLPQSFSNRHIRGDRDEQGELDLNKMSCCPSQHLLRAEKNVEEGLLTIGLGSVKLNVHHTGFKPYKRCSMEAKESTKIVGGSSSNHNDDKGAKRMRFEAAEAST